MPIGPFGEIIGTTGTLDGVASGALCTYKTKVTAPKNPKLLRPTDIRELKMMPSQFMFQMSMDTEQKLANIHTMNLPQKVDLLDMAETTHQKASTVNIDEPMFQPFPSEIFFQNYEPFETYEVPFVLRNNDQVPRLVKVTQANSPYFKVISPNNVGHKVGPGLPTTFRILFTPESVADYTHELVCTTDRERFVVPVRAIGARAILDFPDEVTFPENAVKFTSSRTLLVRNIGNADAKFSLATERPFSVSPATGSIPVNGSLQISVEFKPLTCGDHHRELLLEYHTGEKVYISLYGAAFDALVRLDKNSIRIENTYLSMANQRTVTISNRSNVIAHYRWTRFATLEEEDQQKLMFRDELSGEEATESDRFLEECLADPTLRDKMSILSRTFHNRKRLVQDDKMLFADDVISIDPVEGDIWPNSTGEVQVIFKPEKAGTYDQVAFCDITGRESRLPLRIKGEGIGPKVQFSFDDLDMGNIFVGSTHTYEVVLINKGDIDAIFSLVPPTSGFGKGFQFNPCEGIVMPDGHQAIQITFSSALLGHLDETFQFVVDGSPQKLALHFTGSVIGPTFHFDVPRLKFGTVSYGFVHSLTCTLINTALVPMSFHLRVPGDGAVESIASTSDYDSTLSESGSTLPPPREFEVTPSSGTLEPSSEVKVRVDLCSNSVKKYDSALVVDVEGVGEEVVCLPIVARCIVPHINVLTPILDYSRCFLRHPYEHHVKLNNDTDLPAKYELVPQIVEETTELTYSSPQPKGILPPRSVTDVPIVITPQTLDQLEATCQLIIFGSPEVPLDVQLLAVGEGPVVHVTPASIDWGTVPVLVDKPYVLTLSNESLIPAKFTAFMVHTGSVWRVEPQEGEIPPETQITMTVTACLDDCISFHDKLKIDFINSPTQTIPVTSRGVGNTIVSDPPMTPTLNLGPHFSSGPCKRTFTLTNRGRRHQTIVWNNTGFSYAHKTKKNVTGSSVNGKKGGDQGDKPVFSISPHRMNLCSGESCSIVLEGIVHSPQVVQERLVCHAIIGRAGGKELIMRVKVICEFITPVLTFSTDALTFIVNKEPTDSLDIQSQELEITNVSSLPLTACLSLPLPFQINHTFETYSTPLSQQELWLGIGETRAVQIEFDPAYKEDAHTRVIDEELSLSYREHPHKDSIALRGEVHFPNILFERSTVDFGCILNDTEVTRYLNITNNSPMEVKYRWSFLTDGQMVTFREESPEEESIEEETEEQDEEQGEVEGDMREGSPLLMDNMEMVDVEMTVEGAESPRTSPHLLQPKKEVDMISIEAVKSTADGPISQNNTSQNVEADTQSEGYQEKGELEQQEFDEDEDKDSEVDVLGEEVVSRCSSRQDTPNTVAPVNTALATLLDPDEREINQLGVEEVFDILPLYGTLKPGDMEQVTLTFYGHAYIQSNVTALCAVEGGPTYELPLKGEASLVQYKFDCLDIDYGKIMYNRVAVAELTLTNTGHVGLDFMALGMDPSMRPQPSMPVMTPHCGFIEPHSEQTIVVKFLPGVPDKFHKSFQIQVAHFGPDTVNIFGEGVFPRVSLDLPRVSEGGQYETLVKEARERLTKETKVTEKEGALEEQREETHMTNVPSELEVQMEVERLMIEEYAEAQQAEERNHVDILCVHSPPSQSSKASRRTSRAGKSKSEQRPSLPDYVLDFGHVVLGTVRSHIIRATNTGWFPVSFSIDRQSAYDCGFNVELNRVKQLPGAPHHETLDFVVTLDPRGANVGLGELEATAVINIVSGPQINLRLKANVTMPDMQISTDILDFSEVRCGECQVITVQLYNHKPVTCEWDSQPSEKEKAKMELEQNQAEKHVPMHLRRKVRIVKKPRIFEMMPATGCLLPGQRQNVQIKFMPIEERFYESRLTMRLSQSSQRIMVLCRGQGQEPHIEFNRNLIEFGPILPHSPGDEQEVIFKNPCSFPIEFYNLEFDKTYLDEEKVLRLMKGYDENNTILLPPRPPGDKLPSELTDYYEEQMCKLEEAEQQRREAEQAEATARSLLEERAEEAEGVAASYQADPVSSVVPEIRTEGETADLPEDKVKEMTTEAGVGELEVTPVSAAIARHLGIDLSPEGKAARNRRGITIIVHGAPVSGKTTTAVNLAKMYEVALLTVDGVVQEAISNGNTPAGLRARELCAEAALRRAEELKALEGTEAETKTATGGLSVEALTAHTQGTGQVTVAQSVAHSLVSNRKTSTISDQKSKDKHHATTAGTAAAGPKQAPMPSVGEAGSQVLSTPPPLMAPIARRLSLSASVSGEQGLVSCVLPDQVLVEILAERLMLNDCHRGVVFDGLETLFSQNHFTTLHSILKALNNRKYIFMVSLKLQYNNLKEKEKKAQEKADEAAVMKREEELHHLEEMSEDEYDALSEQEKAHIDQQRLDIKKERLRREYEERQEREKREREAFEAEQRRLEEERAKGKKKRGGEKDVKDAAKKTQGTGGKPLQDSKSGDKMGKSQEGKKPPETEMNLKTMATLERPDSHEKAERGESAADDARKKKEKLAKDGKRPVSNEGDHRTKVKCVRTSDSEDMEETQKDTRSDADFLLVQRFRTFEHSYKEISDLVDFWERSTASICPISPSEVVTDQDEAHPHPTSGRKGKKDKHDKSKEDKKGEKASKEAKEAKEQASIEVDGDEATSDAPNPITEAERREKRLEEGIGIPHLVVECNLEENELSPVETILQTKKLPSLEQVLDGLGLGTSGPPIPPPAVFSVTPYPVKRHAPPGADTGHYIFVASSPDDPNVSLPEEKSKDEDHDDDKSMTPDGRKEDSLPTPTKGGKASKDKGKDKRKTSAKGRPSRRSSLQNVSPPPNGTGAASETDGSIAEATLADTRAALLQVFRWVIPPQSEVVLRLRFISEELGQFDQTLNFEILGTRRRYQLYCRGVCAFPSISREPRIVFPRRKKNKQNDEIVHKKYVLANETFEFGPLLVGKSRDKYKEGKYPENMEKLTIQNTSPMDADITFCYMNDSKGETYLLDPPMMMLKPNQSQELRIWAYPKVPGVYEDSIICCVKENPEPIVFRVLSFGVQPELEMDKKVLHFDKVLLHRKDTKTLYLRNSTMLPVAWRLNLLENLGEDFSVSQESGIIEPKSEYALHAYFRAMKPVITTKKAIRLEVSDADNIRGLLQSENIQVHAEAYDVALDMSFPKGADGGIDFDVIRVMDEQKQTCSLKNKGKYDISYQFNFEPTESCPQSVCDLFSILPNRGMLTPVDRPAQVQVIFRSTEEILVKDQPILRCQVIEPNIGHDGETIASIPIKLSVKSVFSKYKITPHNDINFGAMLANSKKTRTFTIENKGDRFDFKYNIHRLVKESKPDERKRQLDAAGGMGSTQSRLVMGMFSVFPAFGYILPGGQQVITVDSVAENTGRFEEEMAIEVTGRAHNDCPAGIPYKLLADVCVPSINTTDLGAIFEEHRVCKNFTVWQRSNPLHCGGVFCEEENRFVFNNVLVGVKARARFKISNNTKVPCDVAFSVKSTGAKVKGPDVFEVEPARAQVPAHSHMYAIVTFSPHSMQSYSAVFEAINDQNKGRGLSFEVTGEGNLPRASILKPSVRNKKGQALLLFKKTLVTMTDSLPVVITNDGTLPSKVNLDLVDPDDVFDLHNSCSPRAAPESHRGDKVVLRRPHAGSVTLEVGEVATFNMTYKPSQSVRSQAQLRLSVVNNQYEDTVIQLVGEGYHDDITLDNVPNMEEVKDTELEEGNMADDDVPAAKGNLVKFGGCFIEESKTVSFTMRNHSTAHSVRFVWPDHPQFKFSPLVGHLHPGRSKDISLTFQANKPTSFTEHELPCKVNKVTFDKPVTEVADWDDRVKVVKWVDAVAPTSSSDRGSDVGKPPTPVVAQRPAKRKVVETEPEPVHQETPDTARTVDLLVSVTAEYSKVKCKEESITFRDTLMLQTRVYEFQLYNKGSVRLEYNWKVLLDEVASQDTAPTDTQRPLTAAPLVARPGTARPSSAALTESSDDPYSPFDIVPQCGQILPGKKANFTLKFSPLDVNSYTGQIVCSVPNLEEGKLGPAIAIKARSLMPYCHFELVDSDYIRSARRNPELRGPGGSPPGSTLDPNTRVIELTNVGVGTKQYKRFDIVNPTNEDYSFSWVNVDEANAKKSSDFKCTPLEGTIRSGKQAEVIFEFVSSGMELVESFWRFHIAKHNLSIPFLLVGHVKDPAVSMDRSHVNFRSLLIGHEAEDELVMINSEETPFNFSFVELSCRSPVSDTGLHVIPLSGTIPANSRYTIKVRFTPSSDKEVNFNLVCNVKRKPEPLTVNVKAEGYSMGALLICEDSAGARIELSKTAVNQINFGDVELNERAFRNLFIVNTGKFNFDYAFTLDGRFAESLVSVTPMTGAVEFGQRAQCQVSFCPNKSLSLRNCHITLKISNGPSYIIQTIGNGVTPGLSLSFTQYNFGPCFIHRAGMPINSTTLKLTNNEKREISVDCRYTPSQHLHHDFQVKVIPAGQSANITFTFYPREAKRYRETIVFEINGLSKQSVEILGLGTDMKVQVADPRHRIVKLGALRIGQTLRKLIPIVNNSPAPITFNLGMTPSSAALQDRSILKISPPGLITLPAKGGTDKVEIVFSPKTRIPQFSEEVLLECVGLFQPLFVITGSCQGIDISLDTESIPFGAVVQRSSSSRKLVLINKGDIGARFKWDAARFAPDFSISPVQGYVSAGMEVPLEVDFHPQEVNNDVRYENLRCHIEGGKSLRLTLTGTCISMPSSKEMVHFSTHVRQKETKNVVVANRSNQHWDLRPVIDGESWTGADTFSVEPQSARSYEITYHPLTVTQEAKKHLGTVFFPLKDGSGILYNLVGNADPPRPTGKISRDVPCKTSYTETISVSNWLKKPQRFRAKIEPIKTDKFDPGTVVKGLDYIDVAGNSKRDYKISFYAHREGTTMFKMVFLNEQTGEYQYYEVSFRAGRPGVMSTVELTTPVRQSVPHTITLENPLNAAVTFTATCNVPEILMPNQLSVPANSEAAFNFEYLPLKVCEQQGRLEFNSTELGLYLFELHLKASPAGPERALHFTTCLGLNQVNIAKFLNFAKQKTDYTCQVDNPDFHVDKTVAAAPGSSSGTEVVVEVLYEPSHLGESRGQLTVSSTNGGDYYFPLFAHCLPPKPQGPFTIKANSSTTIMFRNIFTHTTAFVFQVDNPLFHITKQGDNIRSRKDQRVVVGFDGNDAGSGKAAVMGKLTISCAKSAGGSTNAQWVYYLKGVASEK